MATVKGRVLLGWLPLDRAIDFLLNQCEFTPPIDAAGAAAMWQLYRARVDALPARMQAVPSKLGLTPIEAAHVRRFTAFAAARHAPLTGVHKVDLRELTIHQYHVVTDRSADYIQRVSTPHGWLNECLPTTVRASQVQLRVRQVGLETVSEIDVPHAEFLFVPDLGTGAYTATEMLRHVTAMDSTDRTFLWAGYHRSFAKVSSTPTATVPAALVAFAQNVIVAPSAPTPPPGVAAGNVAGNGIDPLCPLGAKAARFGDFFVDGLFMDVDLRKKRYQLQVHAKMVAIDA
jgi:hypothetical protein